MRGRKTEDLRLAVDCLPRRTREAMLEGVRQERIIVGAYTDRSGGVCPMLAAHRRGGRTDMIAFARAWDRFTGAKGRPRPATERERTVLAAHLEASLLEEGPGIDLGAAIASHQRTARRRRAREARGLGFGWLRSSRAAEPEREEELV